jgi:hypothetical protein
VPPTTFLLGAFAVVASPAAVCAAEPGGAYPASEVLDAVKSACSSLQTLEGARTAIAAAGWRAAVDPGATPVGAIVKFGSEAGAKMLDGTGKMLNQPEVYSRTVAGEGLWLVLSGIEMSGVRVHGCRVYDPLETRTVSAPAVAEWVGREPTATIDRAELTKFTWEPGLVEGQDSFEMFRVPADSPLKALVKVDGLAWKADQVFLDGAE